jgi:hypothetical protein
MPFEHPLCCPVCRFRHRPGDSGPVAPCEGRPQGSVSRREPWCLHPDEDEDTTGSCNLRNIASRKLVLKTASSLWIERELNFQRNRNRYVRHGGFVVERLTIVQNENGQFLFYDGTSQRQSMVKSWGSVFQKVSATAKPAIKGGPPHRFRGMFAVSPLPKSVSMARSSLKLLWHSSIRSRVPLRALGEGAPRTTQDGGLPNLRDCMSGEFSPGEDTASSRP